MEHSQDRIFIYDTTLRDGSQRKGISYSLEDKLKLTKLIDALGVAYIEGGWPGSNPKDCEYFRRAQELTLSHAKIAAFGSTRHAGAKASEDRNIQALMDANTPVVTLVGKSWTLHVTEVLGTTLAENLAMISESVKFFKTHGREVIYDAEHFFDGFVSDPQYALNTLRTALEAGADWIVLCDTNGGSLPERVRELVSLVRREFPARVGIHTHNDCELAVANSLTAVRAGCLQVQGTLNGYGERCGNANLVSIISNLQLKMGYRCVADDGLSTLTTLSRQVSEIANLSPDEHAAFVGAAAFAHKGGIHVAAVEKLPQSYEHIDPGCVGNARNFLLSELSGRSNVRMSAAQFGIALDGREAELLKKLKEQEFRGFQYENAEGSFELLLRRESQSYLAPFETIDMLVVSERRRGEVLTVEAILKLRVNGEVFHTASEGAGPVDALDGALRKALLPVYPELSALRLVDYKVRILDPEQATAATTRVIIEATSGEERWATVGVSHNIIEASYAALIESYELFLLRQREQNCDDLRISAA